MEKEPEPYLDLAEKIEAADALELAIIVVDSVALRQNPHEDPRRFWEIIMTLKLIEQKSI